MKKKLSVYQGNEFDCKFRLLVLILILLWILLNKSKFSITKYPSNIKIIFILSQRKKKTSKLTLGNDRAWGQDFSDWSEHDSKKWKDSHDWRKN